MSNLNNDKNDRRGHQDNYANSSLLWPETDVQLWRLQSTDDGNRGGSNDVENDNSHPLIVKLFPFTTGLTLIMLLLIYSDLIGSSDATISNNASTMAMNKDVITTRILQKDSSSVLCADKTHSTITELTYTYFLETSEGIAVDETIKSLEYEIQEHLADVLLFCNLRGDDSDSKSGSGGNRKKRRDRDLLRNGTSRQLQTKINTEYAGANTYSNNDDDWNLVDEFSLKIVGISSRPDDEASDKKSCVARKGKECTVVRGSLHLLLMAGADLKTNDMPREEQSDSMLNDLYVAPLIEGLQSVKYVAPAIYNPSDNISDEVNDDYFGGTSERNIPTLNPGMSRLEIVVVATLISTIVGLIGSFVLFKKVFSKQNCMSGCDGTGIDKQYIEQCNMDTIPVEDQDQVNGSDSSQSGRKSVGWNMNSVMDTSGVLSSIDENSIPPSDASYYSNASTAFSTNKSIALKSVSSMHSDLTRVVTNESRNRTPAFGGVDDKENAPPPPPSDSSVMT
eukprot:CAMPEP_0203685824 /NCGR_PEP_ID=MMETSP0090-20130426/48747_1 /ASSEMBLY_ACC=CAM_ASM_001088 /TAXON_ID=426623 /ORGANISM="Chaetoceros affinis, Strain CCMP159" /LENGTH=506 /DNA_ID=CAMNT_0050555033 /DNA_START=12 /DNA_END=1533 /DNA_ORIENTATION=+